MATLEKIRQKAGVLVAVVIGLALLAFIMGDMLKSGSSLFKNSQLEIAKVAGNSIPVQKYQERLDKTIENYKRNSRQNALDEATTDQIRQQTWDDLIRENVMKKEYDELGLNVGSDELFDMVQGKNIHPSIKKVPIFQDQTGQFDPALVIQFLKNLDQDKTGNYRASWLEFEKSIARERLNNKYNSLIKKGLYVTTEKAKEEAEYRATKVNFDYISEPYNSVPDSLISFTEEDIQNYYDEHKDEYKQKATRKVEYVTFDETPSAEDDRMAHKWMEDIKEEFKNAENDKQFVNLNGDVEFDDTYYKKGELSPQVDSFAFNAKIGDIYGIYSENQIYKIAKLTSIKYLPDSVKARHILIRPDESTGDINAAKHTVDSLKELVLKGADFARLALKYGSDGTASKGGDLGWFTAKEMVQPFSDTCFFSPKGHITTVITQHGAHLVQVTDRGKESKKVQVAILERAVEPSSKTVQFIYQKASEFAGKNSTKEKFEKAADEQGINKKVSPPLRINDKTIAGLESPRELVRWAFNAELGSLSPVYEFGDKFVVAMLIEVNEEGNVPLDQIRTEIENLVKKEKAAEFLLAKVQKTASSNDNLEAIAKTLGVSVKSAKNVNFSAFSIPGLGVENEVLAYATETSKGQLSPVIKGTNGIYILKVTDVIESDPIDTKTEQKKLIQSFISRVDYQTYETLKEKADVVDKRYKFY